MVSVAYLVDEWIALSQTFIREEVAELRGQGVHVEVVALGRGDMAATSHEPATYLPDLVPATQVGRVRALLSRPRDAAQLVRAQKRIAPERVPHRAALPAAAAHLRSAEVSWVHAHFGWEAAACAEVLAAMLGTGWSFTAHAKDIFVDNRFLAGRLARADRLVTVCRYNLEQMELAYGSLPPTELVVCGVHLPAPVRREDLDVDVVAVGRLVPKKGFDVLVDAAALLRRQRPDLQIDVIGDGPERSTLAAQIRAADLDGTVHLLGAQPHEVVLSRMERARLVVLPARIAADGDRDSMPVVLKEAMARGVPVVATDVAAIPEMVDEAVGRLVAPDQPAALADAMGEILGDPALAATLGEAGRDRVGRAFTLTGEVARLRSCFERWPREIREGR
jgi:glycosyltransferase involved in cell wall biosynthesis